MVGDDRFQGSLNLSPFNLIDLQINCFNCSRLSVVPTHNFRLARPATPSPDGIGTASPLVPTAVTVPPYTLCVENPPQYLGPDPDNTAQAPATLPAFSVVAVRPLIRLASETADILCPVSPCKESNSASIGPASSLAAPALAPTHLYSNPLLAITRSTASTIQRAPCIDSFLAGKQQPTLSPPPCTVNRPASPLLKEYAELGCPADVVLAWTLTTIISLIVTGPHASTLTPEILLSVNRSCCNGRSVASELFSRWTWRFWCLVTASGSLALRPWTKQT